MELLDEVLDAPQRIRVVLCGIGMPKEELCLAAALRCVDNGQPVLYLNPTSLGQQRVLHELFPPRYVPSVTFSTLEWVAARPYPEATARELLATRPALIILHDAFLASRWSEARVVTALRLLMRDSGARLLIVSPPHRQLNRPLAASRLYRLCRQSELMPEVIGVWHWPTPPELRSLFTYYYTPSMFLRELDADWSTDATPK